MIPAPLTLLARTQPIINAGLLDGYMQRLLGNARPPEKEWMHGDTPHAMEMHHPRRFRANEALLATHRVTQHYSPTDDPNGLGWLDSLFDEFYRFDGDHVMAREEKRSEYAQLCAQMHPALPVAWHLSGLLHGGRLAMTDLRRIVDAATPSFLPPTNRKTEWADLHVHLGGSTETSLSLLSLAIEKYRLKEDARLPSFDYLRINQEVAQRWLATYQTLFYLLLNAGNGNSTTGTPRSLRDAWRLGTANRAMPSPKAWLALHQTALDDTAELMHRSIYAFDEGDSQRAWLYWLTALCLMYRKADAKSTASESKNHHSAPIDRRSAVLAFLNLAHQFRKDMIHDGVGLSRFVRYFNSRLRKSGKHNQQQSDGLRQLLGAQNQVAEIKRSGGIENRREAKKFIRQTLNVIYRPVRAQRATDLRSCLERIHICIHFLRKHDDQPGSQKTIRYLSQRQEAFKSAYRIDRFLRSPAAANERIDGVKIDLTALIRGLDVASDELATPTEVFAPAIRWLRRSPLKSSLPLPRNAMRGLHLSIHAGEDYNHLLSGMRKIDETVTFCDMRQHDRIGHGLAMGIRPADWLRKQPEVVLTAEEHLDNLVWAWHQAVCLAGQCDNAEAVALRFEKRIRLYAKLVYPDFAEDLSPERLYRAWCLRRNCPLKWQKAKANGSLHPELKHWVPDLKIPDPAHLDEEQILLERLYHCYQFQGSKYREQLPSSNLAKTWNKVVLVKQGNALPSREKPWEDWISDAELDIMEAIQDNLLEKYSQRGLIIEVNPSSNVFIGRIEDYHDHPIFRWHPPSDDWLKTNCNRFGLRSGVMPVCVNTDDLGIFPTTLSNEFELLKIAAREHHGFGWNEVERWAESLRKFGVEQFYRSHASMIRN